ncbi:MAG: hypothetical protein ACE5I1_32030, partial [bacterium]
MKQILPLSFQLVQDPIAEKLWNRLVRTYHYLSTHRLVGFQLKYLVYSGSTPLAALSWNWCAYKLLRRDEVLLQYGLQRRG